MRSARFCAPTPRPGKFLGQVVTMRQLMVPCAMAGIASVVAAAAPMVATEADLKNSRLFIYSSHDRTHFACDADTRPSSPVVGAHQLGLEEQCHAAVSSMLLPRHKNPHGPNFLFGTMD